LSFDVQPIMIDGRVMVPFRTIFEALGYTVNWDNDTKTVIANQDISIAMAVGNNNVYYGDTIIESDVAPVQVPYHTGCRGLNSAMRIK